MKRAVFENAIGEVGRWHGTPNRAPIIKRPCDCGCDFPDGRGVGYIIGSDDKGNGYTIWIADEELYQVIWKSFNTEANGAQNY